MKHQLAINNFGPIKKATINTGDLTIFVGPHASGKSLAAKLLYFLQGLEGLISAQEFEGTETDTTKLALTTLTWWLGNPLSVYTQTDSKLKWDNLEIVSAFLAPSIDF